jgi:transposase-like protein
MTSVLDKPFFRDEAEAYAKLESIVWPNGPVCVHCGETGRIGLLKGKATRPGVYKCYRCRKQFRLTVDTVFEASHIPLRDWLKAVYLLVSSKKGVSSNQLHRTMGITLKSAWFMSHRIREAMKEPGWKEAGPLGGEGMTVEADETWVGGKAHKPRLWSDPSEAGRGCIGRARRPASHVLCSARDGDQSGAADRPAYAPGQPLHDR